MGQLEKYGLYVLCLVIFLILGVTLWGGGDAVTPQRHQVASTGSARGTTPQSAPVNATAPSAGSTFDLLLGDEPRRGGPSAPSNGGARTPGGNRGTATDASAPKPAPQPDGQSQPDAAKDTPPPATSVVYTVQEGDTFGSLARAKLGRESLWPEIQKLNPAIKPEKLRAGDEIRLPTPAALAGKDAARTTTRTAPLDKPLPEAPDGKRFYTVKKGDNFERIAAAQLGSKRRTKELMELNSSVPPTKLQLGMRIQLPAK
jgi:LysM repeat protein